MIRYSAMHMTEGKTLDPTALPVKVVHEKTDELTVAFDTPDKTTLADFARAMTTAGFTDCIIGHSTRTRIATARLMTWEDWHRIHETDIIIDGKALPLRRIHTFDPNTTSVMLRNVYGHSVTHMAVAIKAALAEYGTVLDIILGRIDGLTTKNAWALIQLTDPEKKLPTTIEINGDMVSLIGTAVTEACRYCRKTGHTINECMAHPGNRQRNAKKAKLPEDQETTDQLTETQKRARPIRQPRLSTQANPAPVATPNQFAALAVEKSTEETTPTATLPAPVPAHIPLAKATPKEPQTRAQTTPDPVQPIVAAPEPATRQMADTPTHTHRMLTRSLGHFLPSMAQPEQTTASESPSLMPHPDDMEISSLLTDSPAHFEPAQAQPDLIQLNQLSPTRDPLPSDLPSVAAHRVYQPQQPPANNTNRNRHSPSAPAPQPE
ncbi:hypothetical protein LPJ73_000271 [Coemansia sp. RSA 2703]|nr:hypothetical protein LPJ73_000271 [Coemansia sp. RSA 2703]KAJ2378558.1 hypothetical protein IW150_000722 [Coemansia sp. RSA 2607]